MTAATTPRLRFAPSPTGYLHVGGARTALFNWLHARKMGGQFLLRIEDTDKARSSDEHIHVILEGLAWLGLDYDEDLVLQSAGLERHRALAQRLLAEGQAYEDEGAIRFRMPDTEIAWDDAIKERIAFKGSDLEDWVILRSDGSPTYNFVVVCDDIDMGITLVMRGDDHISNTPKQIAIYEALRFPLPTFAHVPNIHGPDGKKLSKRHGATAVGDYQKEGILPGAMRNFLALLGWNPGDERELFWTSAELIDAFSLERIQKKPALFDLTKLEWMNGQYVSRMPPGQLLELIRGDLWLHYTIDATKLEPRRLLRAIEVCAERARTTIDLAFRVAVRYDAALMERDEKATRLIQKDPDGFMMAIEQSVTVLEQIAESDWMPDTLEARLKALAEEMGVGLGKVMQPIRVALTGQTVSEGVNLLLEVVGKDESLARLRNAIR